MENTTDMFFSISHQLQGPALGIILGGGVGVIIGLGICMLYISSQAEHLFLKLKVSNLQNTKLVHIVRFLGIFMLVMGCLLLVVLATIYTHDSTFPALIITSVLVPFLVFIVYFFIENMTKAPINGNK